VVVTAIRLARIAISAQVGQDNGVPFGQSRCYINENVLRFINTADNSEQQGGSWLSYSQFTAFRCIPSNKTNDES
jgi:hypothetical protein